MFVHGVRECSHFTNLHVEVQLSQHHLLKRLYYFPTVHAYLFCQRLIVSVWVYFWALYSVPLIHMSVFVLIICCFDYYSFAVL